MIYIYARVFAISISYKPSHKNIIFCGYDGIFFPVVSGNIILRCAWMSPVFRTIQNCKLPRALLKEIFYRMFNITRTSHYHFYLNYSQNMHTGYACLSIIHHLYGNRNRSFLMGHTMFLLLWRKVKDDQNNMQYSSVTTFMFHDKLIAHKMNESQTN